MTLKMRTFAPLTLLLLSLGIDLHQPASTVGNSDQMHSNIRPPLWSARLLLWPARSPV